MNLALLWLFLRLDYRDFLPLDISKGFDLDDKEICHHFGTFESYIQKYKKPNNCKLAWWNVWQWGNLFVTLLLRMYFVFLVLYIVFAKKYVSIVIGKMFVYLKLQRKWGESKRNNVYRLADESFKCKWIKQRSSR